MTALRADAGDPVKAFIADCWTLEFDLALCPDLAASVHEAVQLAKTTTRNPARLVAIATQAAADHAAWKAAGRSDLEIAVEIYRPLIDKEASKAQVAEQLAAILRRRKDTADEMRKRLPPYLVRAIDYVTGGPPAPPVPGEDSV